MGYTEQYKAAKDKGQTVELSSTFHDFKKDGDTIVGKLLARFPVKGAENAKEYNHYIMDTDKGNVKFFCGSVFDNEVGNALVIGKVYAICYAGQEEIKGGRKVNTFTAEAIDTTGVSG